MGRGIRGNVTFLSPNKKVTKEIGLRGGVRVGVAEVTWKRFRNSRRQIHPPLRNLPPWQKIDTGQEKAVTICRRVGARWHRRHAGEFDKLVLIFVKDAV